MSSLQDSWVPVSVNTNTSIYLNLYQTQSFAASGDYTMTRIDWYGKRVGAVGTCYLEIFATDPDDNGKPTGSALMSQAFDGDALVGTGSGYNQIDLDVPFELTRATTYAIALRAPNGSDTSNKFDWQVDNASAYESGENYYTTDGGSSFIRASNNATLPFKIYGNNNVPTLLKDVVSDEQTTSGASVNDVNWLAQTIKMSTSITLVGLDLSLYATDTDAATITVGIYPTDGSDKPDVSGSALGEVTISRADLTPLDDRPNPWVAVNFDTPIGLQADTFYAIVLKGNNDELSRWNSESISGTYPNGQSWESDDSGSTWNDGGAGNNGDYGFKTYIFDIAAVIPTDVEYTKKLVAAGNNQIWYEDTPGVFTELVAARNDINCGDMLNMFEMYGKVFVVNKTNKKVADFQNSKITTADVLGAGVYPQFGALLTGGTSGAAMVVDYITSLSGACTIYGTNVTDATFTSGETVSGINPDETSVSFSTNSAEDTGPHWYDWTTYGNSTDFGALPPSATLGCMFRGRAVVSGNNLAPHQWYMSRQANPWDWLYGVNDAQSAVAGNNTDAGEVGDGITSLNPYKDDYLIFGGIDSIWYMTGDPTAGGSLGELDLTGGMYGANSWCWGEENELWFWGLNGIYKVILPGGVPKCISEIRLPGLIDAEAPDPNTHRIIMSYDKRRAGILTTITLLADGSNSCYWFDFRTNGFFPESYPDSNGVFSSIPYNAVDSSYKQVMYGCTDGYIRYHDDSSKDDDDTVGVAAIESYVTFGPFLMSNSAVNEGKITGFDLILGGGGSSPESDGAAFEIYTGTSAQEVVKKMAAGSPIAAAGSVRGSGRKRKSFKRKIRGVYCGIKVKNITLAQTFAMEQALIDITKAGRLR